MSNELLDIYGGDQPYVFVSYSHRDEAEVFPLVRRMQENGYRVWLDRGIEVGTEWSNNIADRLRRCEAVIFFVSKNSVASENCLDEVSFAKSHKKPAILIYLEDDVVMPEGMEMQTARFQRMYVTRHANVDGVVRALATAPLLVPCRPAPASTPAPAPAPVDYAHIPHPTSAPVYAPAPVATPKKSKWKTFLIVALVVLIIAGIAIKLTPDESAVKNPSPVTRVYSLDEVVTAFEEGGYDMQIDTNVEEFDEFVSYAAAYSGVRTVSNLTDEIYMFYLECTGTESAKALYDAMVDEFSASEEHSKTAEYWWRSSSNDETLGESVIVSQHDNVVLVLGVEYYDYVSESAYYDNRPAHVLSLVNF